MTLFSTSGYKKVGGVFFYSALRTIPLILLLCLMVSCSKDDDATGEDSMPQLYTESLGLENHDADSVSHFENKYLRYLESHPEAKSHTLYPAINSKIIENFQRFGVKINDEWAGEIHINY